MLFAKLVTEKTLDEIAAHNQGQYPDKSTLDNDTFFVYSDDTDWNSGLISGDTFYDNFEFLFRNDNDNAVREI